MSTKLIETINIVFIEISLSFPRGLLAKNDCEIYVKAVSKVMALFY